VPAGAPVINGLHRQRDALVNFLRALIGLPPDATTDLEQRLYAEPEIGLKAEPECEREPSVVHVVDASADVGGVGSGRRA
jgi:hypothetical protein